MKEFCREKATKISNMLKSSDNTSKREFKRAEDSMREKLRAKIRQRIHNPPNEGGDENVNTLNHEKSVRPRRGYDRNTSSRDSLQVSMFLMFLFILV